MRKNGILFALFISIVLILAACGTGSEKANSDGDGKKKLRVVTDAAYAPFEYMDKDKIIGFDVDIFTAAAEEAGYDFEIVNVGWDPLFAELENGTADVGLSAITINDDRLKSYDFSVPYFESTNKILAPEGTDIKKAADLTDKTVAVQSGTTGADAVDALLGNGNEKVKKFENNNLAILEMKNQGAAAVVADNAVLEAYAKNNPQDNFIVIEDKEGFESEYYGFMFPKDSEMEADLSKGLNAIFDNGKYAEIYKEWFGQDPDIENLKAQQ
ncbi:basic amino acid ABC transporter substrate-binding protein [Niallia circulans]|uniref:transporter substrate-binding domain-containing protein n=1 Tax=Niallia circulans TaxID=1397 RepID=UPI00201DAE92|nr:transporter substrate-binding domain-containing protein [Niallia circulans]UQZ74656.1 basic amino acid ABC transporter substrate-binding protein [Niallia circulans]